MPTVCRAIRICLLVVLSLPSSIAWGASDSLEAGFAAVDITPKLDPSQPIWLAGKELKRAATGVHDPLFARATVLRHGGRKFALVSVDSIGLPYPSVQRSRANLSGYDYVLVASTHSHESPDVIGVWGPSQSESGVIPAYVAQVEAGIVAAVQKADAAAVPVRVEYATADDPSLLGDFRLPEVYDGVIRVLRFVKVADDKTLGLVVQWNSHGVEPGKNSLISRDFMGATVDALEKRHQCSVVFFDGAIGGLMGTPKKLIAQAATAGLKDKFEFIDLCGAAIADLADRALKEAQPIKLTPFDVFTKPILVPLANEGFRAARAGGVLTRPVYTWKGTREERGEEIAKGKVDGEQALETEVAYVRLGELDIAAIPGELYPELVYGKYQDPVDPGADFPDAALETPVVKILPSSKFMLFGLANDELGYIIPKRQWDVVKPFAYGRTSSQYGERNSVGPETARMLLEALADRVAESTKKP